MTEHRVALVTGGSRGLGAQIVRELARSGYDVAFTFVQGAEAAAGIAREVEGLGRRAKAYRANAGDFAKAHEITRAVVDDFGHVDALVCNAGLVRRKPLWELTEADWDDVVDVDLKGTFNYIHAIAPVYMQQRHGKIVSIGSINGLRAQRDIASYNAAKAGLTGLIKGAALELGEFNVNVNIVAPGFIETPSQVNRAPGFREGVLQQCAIKRLGTPEDIAPLVVFLCSEAARHVTGQVIKVDAGQYI